MSAKKEIKEFTRQLKLQIAIETLDIINERLMVIGNMATQSGCELKFSEAHDYLIKAADKQRAIIDKLSSKEHKNK